jgi:hypothetical protein
MVFRVAKSMLGLMVMALAFSTMAPANAVTPGQVCVRTPSGIAFSATVQWTFNGNSSREIATDANGCANFPHLPQGEILLATDAMEIQSGLVQIKHIDLFETVTVDSSGYVLLSTSTNPPEVKQASITFRTNANQIAKPEEIVVGHAHRTPNDGYDEYRSISTSPWTSSDDYNWEIQRNCPENPPFLCKTNWVDNNGVYHFYYFGELAKDLRQLSWYDPDTDQTVTIPANPSAPFVRFKWRDTKFGEREFSYLLTEASQNVTLLQYASIRGIPAKPIKFKKGKPVKVTVTLLDSYGMPWKNQWVYGSSYEDAMKKSRKCKLKDYAKTNKKGKVSFTFCPNKSGPIYFFVETQFSEGSVDLNSALQVEKSK